MPKTPCLALRLLAVVACSSIPSALFAQEEPATDLKPFIQTLDPKIEWSDGPCEGSLEWTKGKIARVAVPEGCLFTGKDGTHRFLVANQNLTGGGELATVHARHAPAWFACFEYSDSGHVKDDDKGELDAASMLEQKQEACRNANAERRKRGFQEFEIIGWSVPPHYDEGTHNLEWGVRLHSKDGDTVNYEVRLLSRVGFMETTLVCSPDEFEVALAEFRGMLAGFAFVPGQNYSEVKPGDPIADFTLTALVAGGAAAAAWKLGIFKYVKYIVIGVAGGVAALWRKLTGRGSASARPPV